MGYSYVPLKLKNEVLRIRKASAVTRRILDNLTEFVHPGITTLELAAVCGRMIEKAGAQPGLLGYKGFPSCICVSVNHVAAHGVPNGYAIKDGDLVTLDLTAGMDGWYGDCAVTLQAGNQTDEKQAIVAAARAATAAGIEAAVAGCRMGDIGAAIQASAAASGYTVLQNFIGHGIGREIHEEPAVLHCGRGWKRQAGGCREWYSPSSRF